MFTWIEANMYKDLFWCKKKKYWGIYGQCTVYIQVLFNFLRLRIYCNIKSSYHGWNSKLVHVNIWLSLGQLVHLQYPAVRNLNLGLVKLHDMWVYTACQNIFDLSKVCTPNTIYWKDYLKKSTICYNPSQLLLYSFDSLILSLQSMIT